MKLYKYFHPDRIDVLLNGNIRFSQPGSFNDPYEMQAYVDETLLSHDLLELMEVNLKSMLWDQYKSLPKHTKKIMSFQKFQLLTEDKKPEIVSQIKGFSARLPQQLNETLFQKTADKAVGVLCLTERKDNLLMWAHYACNHEGFLIEFDITNPFFNQNSNKKNYHFINKVKYSEDVPKTSLLDLKDLDFILTKSVDWKYEEEWRMTRPLKNCAAKITSTPYDICLFDYPKEAVTKIVLGCRHSPELKEKILAICSSTDFKHVKIEQAKIDRSKFGLYFDQV